MKRRALLILALIVWLPYLGYAFEETDSPIGGVLGTPTSYIVTMKKIEFRNRVGTWVTYAEGSEQFDIATVQAGGQAGLFGQGSVLPAGTYDLMRITVYRHFTITGGISNAGSGQPARTETNNPNNGTFSNWGENLTGIAVAATDGGTPTPQLMPIPFGLTFQDDEEEIGLTDMRFTINIPTFTVRPGGAMPTVRVNFDLTGAVAFRTTGAGTALAVPLDPHPTVTVTP